MNVQVTVRPTPDVDVDPVGALARCIQECHSSAQACDRVADFCFFKRPSLVQCIRQTLDCSEMCMATGAIANRRVGENSAVVKVVLEACAATCEACAAECGRYAGNEVFLHCAIACRNCERACRRAAALL